MSTNTQKSSRFLQKLDRDERKRAVVLTIALFKYRSENLYRSDEKVFDFHEVWRGSINQIRTFFLFGQIVESITVDDSTQITFKLIGGIELTEPINEKGRCKTA